MSANRTCVVASIASALATGLYAITGQGSLLTAAVTATVVAAVSARDIRAAAAATSTSKGPFL